MKIFINSYKICDFFRRNIYEILPELRDSEPKIKTHIQMSPSSRTNNSNTGIGKGLGIYFCYDEDNYHGMKTYIMIELWTNQ